MHTALTTPFYHETIKRVVVIFGTVFNSLHVIDDFDQIRKVPLYYAARDKFVNFQQERPDLYNVKTEQTLPRMAYYMTGIAYAPQRMTDKRQRLESHDTKTVQFNRVPYDFTFELYVKTLRFEESLKVVEQILPLFKPSFNVTADDVDKMGFRNDYTITLNSSGYEDTWEGEYSQPRSVLWTLSFTVQGYLYSPNETANRIKETILHLGATDYSKIYETLTAEVIPREANKTDPHRIKETIIKVDPDE